MVYHYFPPSSSSVLCGGRRLRKLPSPEGEEEENKIFLFLFFPVCLRQWREIFSMQTGGTFVASRIWSEIELKYDSLFPPCLRLKNRKRKSKKPLWPAREYLGFRFLLRQKFFFLLGHFRASSIVGTAGWVGDLLWGAGVPPPFSRYLSPFYASFLTYCFFLPPSLQGDFFVRYFIFLRCWDMWERKMCPASVKDVLSRKTFFEHPVCFISSFCSFLLSPTPHPPHFSLFPGPRNAEKAPGKFRPKRKDPSPFPGEKIPKGSKYKCITSWCFQLPKKSIFGKAPAIRVANWSDSKNAMHKAKKCQKVPP